MLHNKLIALTFVFLLSITIQAVQFFPSMELTYHSNRSGETNYTFFTSCSFPPQNIITLLLPGYFGKPSSDTYWGIGEHGWFNELSVFLGIIPLFLALLGIFSDYKPLKNFFTGLLLVSLLIALGKFTPLSHLLFKIPFLNRMRTPARILILCQS